MRRALDWFSAESGKLNITWARVSSALGHIWDEISLVPWGWDKKYQVIKKYLGPIFGPLFSFLAAIPMKVLELVLEGVLRMIGAPAEKILGLFRKGVAVFKLIVTHPLTFVGNLFSAVKLGLSNFLANIGKHLMAGLVTWLTGAITKAGLVLPEKFDIKGIFSLALQILGLTYDRIREKLVKRVGEQTVSRIEKAVTFVRDLIERGPIVIWEKVQQWLSDLKDKVLGGIRDWIVSTIIKQGVIWIMSLLNPAGAIFKVVSTLYKVIKFFIDNWQRIVTFAETVFNSIADIAYGKIGPAAKSVELALARAVPILIGFLANLLGLGGISKVIKDTIEKIRAPIDRAVDKVLDWIVKRARPLLLKAKRLAARARRASFRCTQNTTAEPATKAMIAATAELVEPTSAISDEGRRYASGFFQGLQE